MQQCQIFDLTGRTVFAGFTDAHQHLEGIGRRTKTLSLFGIPTLAETVAAIEDWAETIPEGDWVQGADGSNGSGPTSSAFSTSST